MNESMVERDWKLLEVYGSLDSLNERSGVGIWDEQVHEMIEISGEELLARKIKLQDMGFLDLSSSVAVLTSKGRLALMDKKE
ncbi:hypothetical protein [Methanothrix soehngenii]|jgi:hypothetical protein|uniref:hypothetical protein n=1 Tax=Methanothrix soehngenii TaxID=2223 RepID=UPI002CCAB15D|nr:hypothetical protein [Methanothrix soehngenii]HOS22018.1 hypothetical protein [Methanothrix soehngenii]HPL20321.1 hypothetical protein [Methanothrix soehngenii]